MRKQRNDFKTSKDLEGWYDIDDDWGLIESSLAKQYNIRLRQSGDMPWTEFCNLIGGLMADTPLGNIVGIRSESDPNAIKNFTPEQRKIHRDWRTKVANNKLVDLVALEKQQQAMEKSLELLFGGDK